MRAADRKTSSAKLTPARIRELSALAKRIDRVEQGGIQDRARRIFREHENVREVVSATKSRRMEKGMSLAELSTLTWNCEAEFESAGE